MTDNLSIWTALAKTDPSHTKQFSRAGGFKGTAITPIWTIKRLTEQFGPIGIGWGVNKPEFQMVNSEGEILVYCTVEAWHTARSNTFYGVGGDKVQTKRKDGSFHDDEAFKKAFTDAVGNAFKFVGVGADVHMGLFDDHKYVTEMQREFAEAPPAAEPVIDDAQWAMLATLVSQTGADTRKLCGYYGVPSLRELPTSRYDHAKNALMKKITKEAA